MKTLTPILCILLAGCVFRETFRPRHAALEQASELLQCDDLQVATSPTSPFRRDPLLNQTYVVAWGCGQVAQFNCSHFGTRNGSCVQDEWYQTPTPDQPQGTVKLRVSYRSASGYTQRELFQIDEQPIVRPADSMGRALSVPVPAGPRRLSLGSAPLVQQRHVGTRIGYYSVSTYTYNTTHQQQGCGRELNLTVDPNATYRVELEYLGPNQCEISCTREIQTPGGPALVQCSHFATTVSDRL